MKTPDNRYLPVIDGSRVTWTGLNGCIEVSDFDAGARAQPWARVWNDACDVGFWVRSHRTGRRELFTFDNVETKDGDVIAWTFVSRPDARGRRCSVVILND